MQHFIRKSFTIELIFPKKFLRYRWNKKVSISVQQATIADTLEFREKTKNKQKSTYIIIAYLENFRGKKFSKDEIHYLSSQSKVLSELWEKTFLYGVIDTEPRFGILGKEKGIDGGPTSSIFISLSESTNTPILQIFNEFTYEQLWHIINGMKRNSNNLTKEGRNLNAHRARQKKFKEKYSDEEIKKLLQDNL